MNVSLTVVSCATVQAQQLFANPSLPFHVDVGCARGAFCFDLARSNSNINVLGIEIRRPLAAHCSKKARELGMPNVGFVSCNANVDLPAILQGICAVSRVARVSIQFPDPHWKVRHQKRRVVQPGLVAAVAEHCDGDVFLQSDVLEVAAEMRRRFRDHASFADSVDDPAVWINPNPTGVPTEREVATFAKGLPVYRALINRRA